MEVYSCDDKKDDIYRQADGFDVIKHWFVFLWVDIDDHHAHDHAAEN